MTEQLKLKLNDSKATRWGALVIVAFTMMAAYYVNDVVAPLKTMLETDLAWSSTDFGFFTGGYSFLNVFFLMLIWGGLILDRFGIIHHYLSYTEQRRICRIHSIGIGSYGMRIIVLPYPDSLLTSIPALSPVLILEVRLPLHRESFEVGRRQTMISLTGDCSKKIYKLSVLRMIRIFPVGRARTIFFLYHIGRTYRQIQPVITVAELSV